MMDPELKEKWLEALRSGKYRQGRGKLRNKDDEFCCLGVLCDLVEPNAWNHYQDGIGSDPWHHHENVAFPGYHISSRAGVVSKEEALAHLNDQGATFAEIADYIEENL